MAKSQTNISANPGLNRGSTLHTEGGPHYATPDSAQSTTEYISAVEDEDNNNGNTAATAGRRGSKRRRWPFRAFRRRKAGSSNATDDGNDDAAEIGLDGSVVRMREPRKEVRNLSIREQETEK